jgi:hypothetical protein
MEPWYNVDKEGLAKILQRRGKSWALAELVQNAWDAPGVSTVKVSLTPANGRGLAELVVEDDCPTGFITLAHAYTLFAPSVKKHDPELRGRFNLGDKLVLSLCKTARISTTTGTVEFTETGRKVNKRRRRERGTEFRATIAMTHEEVAEAVAAVKTYIVPAAVRTFINEELIEPRQPIGRCDATLPTEEADADGVLRRRMRKTVVSVFERTPGLPARLFEMGIPVAEIENDTFDVDIAQKVPVTLERDGVRPGYLRLIRGAVLDVTKDRLTRAEAALPWVDEGLSKAALATVPTIFITRFGENAVIQDPSDPEATARAVAAGVPVVPGGALSGDAWRAVKDAGAALPAGQVYATPKPFSEDGSPARRVAPTPSMSTFAAFANALARELLGIGIAVDFFEKFNAAAAYGGRHLSFNVQRLGKGWFEGPLNDRHLDLLIHEFGHQLAANHLSDAYFRALTKLGGQTAMLALERPELFDLSRYGSTTAARSAA